MIWFFYYSNSGCTARFIHEYVFGVPELRLGAKACRFFSTSPHGRTTGMTVTTSAQRTPPEAATWLEQSGPKKGDTVILCVPTYGRFDHRQGKTVDYIPKCLRPDPDSDFTPDAAIVFGNRNFGSDYCAASRELEAQGIPVLEHIEMSGDPDIARTVVRKAMILDGMEPDDPRLPRLDAEQ
jgi:protein involved in ribonucleotide reduction